MVLLLRIACGTQVLLSCNILGNPIGVFSALGTGVRDFFMHPIEGAVVSPGDFALGLGACCYLAIAVDSSLLFLSHLQFSLLLVLLLSQLCTI